MYPCYRRHHSLDSIGETARRASAWRHAGNRNIFRIAHVVTLRLIAQVVENFVFLDWPSKCRPELFEDCWRHLASKRVRGVHAGAPAQGKSSAMNLVRAGFQPDADLRA